ncbi:bifunctional RNase H/acid phosphatase [Actinopolymorpha alba]|uniref:bifunctional RNase H/acid phosphatase n=1 Tax=Actinopolymorpha alba TaxID=533267 RepID=UPI000377A47D|nr:bifunctional RNase H/acid phosphatase [Actinopolymorpha alba]
MTGTDQHRRLIIEADGGSRGNPGPAAYGALVRDAETGAILAEAAEPIGRATNNVAEYRGLLAGLRLARDINPEAAVEVRMDSKLVIEQMAGRWKIKHPDMKQLALDARRVAPAGTAWTWVPRERNKAADALLNKVLDGGDPIWSVSTAPLPEAPLTEPTNAPAEVLVGWGEQLEAPTNLLLLRHGETQRSLAKRFSGSGGEDVALTDRGREQAAAAATALTGRVGIAAVVTSPLRRTRETAELVGAALDLPVSVEPGFAEAAFGEWDGLTFAEVRERWPDHLDAWLRSTSVAPPGGESFDDVFVRVRAARDRLIRSYAGQSVVVVTHVTPIKLLTCLALDVPPQAIFRMELSPASISEVHWYADGGASLRSFGLATHLD